MNLSVILLVVVQLWIVLGSSLQIPGFEPIPLTCCPQLLNPKECGVVDSTNRLVEGEPVKSKNHPWAGLLIYDITGNNGLSPECGASLLNSRFVLTAAHCIKEIPNEWTLRRVRFSELDTLSAQNCTTLLDDGSGQVCRQEYDIEKVIVHPNFDTNNQHNDIALVKTDREVSFSEYVRPICLPLTDVVRGMPFEDKEFTVTGWGQTETENWRGHQQHANVVGKTNELCDAAFSYADVILADTQLCAVAASGANFCKSDNGGPLMRQVGSVWHQVGIKSYVYEECDKEWSPGVFTNVAKYLDWIEEVVNEDHCELSNQ